MNPTAVVAYLALFGAVGFLFIFSVLAAGRLFRPSEPTPEKRAIYECGELPIGSGYLQFDLRFYVAALVFIIFEVELALFFPWAVVFGKANQLANPTPLEASGSAAETATGPAQAKLSSEVVSRLEGLGIRDAGSPPPGIDVNEAARQIKAGARKLALTAMVDLCLFFGVLLVGFAYVWHSGDLDWVRAIGRPTRSDGDVSAVQRGDR